MNYEVIWIIDLDWPKGQALVEMVGWHHRHDGHEFEQAPGAGDGQKSLVCDHGVTKSQTRLSNWTELKGQAWGFPGGSVVKNLPVSVGDAGSVLGWEDPLEKGTATHSSSLAWEIPWTEEPGGYSPSSHKESGTTKRLSTQTHEG